jgi:hypothetical protein
MDTMNGQWVEEKVEERTINRKPKLIHLRIEPQVLFTETDAEVKFRAEDPEGMPVRTSFQWYVNNRKRLGQVRRGMNSRFFQKGDRVLVEVKASDGKHEIQVRSAEVVVENSPPRMLTKPGSLGKLDGVTIRAEDPDNDEILFFLRDAPPGLSIDPKRGVLRYVPSEDPEAAGEFQTHIVVEDTDGEQVVLPLKLTVTPGRPDEGPP